VDVVDGSVGSSAHFARLMVKETVDNVRSSGRVQLCRPSVLVQYPASCACDGVHTVSNTRARQCRGRQWAFNWVVSLKLEDSRTLLKAQLVGRAVVDA
jgi:hypothetical protein